MPVSNNDFLPVILDWIRSRFPPPSRILDVGPGWGKYGRELTEYRLDAVEIHAPYIERYGLREFYARIIVQSVVGFDFAGYDLAIFGDVIEHLGPADACRVLEDCRRAGCRALVQVPWRYAQGPWEGNEHEAHLQPDLTPEVFAERYAAFGFRELAHNEVTGIYVA